MNSKLCNRTMSVAVAMWLCLLVTATCPISSHAQTLCSDPELCIQQLVADYAASTASVIPDNGYLRVNTFVSATRAFDEEADKFAVTQYVVFSSFMYGDSVQVDVTNTLKNPVVEGATVAGSVAPPTTTCSTTTVFGESVSTSGQIGFDTSSGPTIQGSKDYTWSNQYSTTCPTTQITQKSGDHSQVGWTYSQKVPNGMYFPDLLMTNQWAWRIPFSSYTKPDEDLSFTLEASFSNGLGQHASLSSTITVPAPFGMLTIPDASITDVDPVKVPAGGVFTITGENLYPSMVTGVFLSGNEIDPQYYTKVNNKIIVVAPEADIGENQLLTVETIKNTAEGPEITITPAGGEST